MDLRYLYCLGASETEANKIGCIGKSVNRKDFFNFSKNIEK